MSEFLSEICEVFQEVFDDEELVITPATSAVDVDGWDSLMHINLIIAVERRFGVKLATAEIAGLNAEGKNVGSLLELLSTKVSR